MNARALRRLKWKPTQRLLPQRSGRDPAPHFDPVRSSHPPRVRSWPLVLIPRTPYAPPPEALRVPASERILAGEDPPERRDPPRGLRAGPARGGTGITRAASPGGPDGFLAQQPHGVGLRQGAGQPLQVPQVLLQVRTVPLLQAPLQPRQQVLRPLRDAYLFDQLLTPLFHRVVSFLLVCATRTAAVRPPERLGRRGGAKRRYSFGSGSSASCSSRSSWPLSSWTV